MADQARAEEGATEVTLSKDLPSGTRLRHRRFGDVVTLDVRKADDRPTWSTRRRPLPGWWLVDQMGGLADMVIDAEDSDWEVLP